MFRRKKRRDSRKDARRSSRKTQSVNPQQVRRAFTLTASVFVFGAAALLVLVEAPRMQDRLATRAADARPVQIIIEWPRSPGAAPGATWLPGETQYEILAIAHREADRAPNPYSPAALASIAEALERTGWFESIRRVQREHGNIIRVDASWRIPAAVVRYGNVDHLIARGGELLPLEYQKNRSPLPVIIGGRFDPPKYASAGGQLAYGHPWPGGDIQAALEVLALVNTRPWRDQVAAVDVSGYLSSRRIELVTQWDGRAVWGGAPSDSVPGEVTAEMKIRRLDVLHHQFQRIDARRRIVEVAGPVTLVDDSPPIVQPSPNNPS